MAFVATLSSFVGNREIKPSNKTKEEIVEEFSLRLITPLRACEPILEVETDLADSVAQSGSVSSSWLVILPMANCHIFSKSKSKGQGLSTLMLFYSSYISSCFQHSSCRINSTAALRGTFILELMPPEACMGLFITFVRESLANRRGFLLIRAAFGMFLTDS